MKRFTLVVAGIAFSPVCPMIADACLMSNGTNDADYRNLAAQFQGSHLWITPQYTTSTGVSASFTASAVRLNDNWLLTAAHNLYSVTSPTNNSITVGNGYNFMSSPGATHSCSTDIFVFPGFDGTSQAPDLALVRLLSPLPGPSLKIGTAAAGEIVLSVGCGDSGTPATGYLPRDGNVRAFQALVSGSSPGAAANDYYFNWTTFGFNNAGLTLNGRSAPGDSGGGVFNTLGDLVGIVTAKSGSATDAYGATYYMDLTIPEVRAWINKTLSTTMRFTTTIQGNQITVSILDGAPDMPVTLQTSSDLTTWNDFTTVPLNSSGAGTYSEVITEKTKRFFRAKIPR